MTHPCASAKPPSWCNKKSKSKKSKSKKGNLGSVTPAQVAAHLRSYGYKIVAKKTCTVKSGPKKGKLKKGCIYGRGALKGQILKTTR